MVDINRSSLMSIWSGLGSVVFKHISSITLVLSVGRVMCPLSSHRV